MILISSLLYQTSYLMIIHVSVMGKSQQLSSEVENVSPMWCKEEAARYTLTPCHPSYCTAASLLYSTSPMSQAAVIRLPG